MTSSSAPSDDPPDVLTAYPADCQPSHCEFLAGAGGFSGSQLWRFDSTRGRLCLRRWGLSAEFRNQVEFIHRVLLHAAQQGFTLAPLPISTLAGPSWIEYAGHIWELAPWLSGEVDDQIPPNDARLIATLLALAQFHRATLSFPSEDSNIGPSLGLIERRDRVARFLKGRYQQCLDAFEPSGNPSFDHAARVCLDVFPQRAPTLLKELQRVADRPLALQPCIRDVWREHVLFTGDTVSGLIDYGGMRLETVAIDIARLTGSLVENDTAAWQIALAVYDSVRPLSAQERELVTLFDRCNVLLSGLSWIEWLFVEQREFTDRDAITKRLQHFARRLSSVR